MKTAERQYLHHVSVPSGEGIRVDETVTIERPVEEVYSFWRQLENLPQFMRHLESVTVQDDLHSHWVVKAPAGKKVEWDAEVIEQRENEMISWRSVPGSEVENAGSVWFTAVPGGQATVVRVELKYVPPAGKAGHSTAKLFGADAGSKISDDLRRLKILLETGHLPDAEDTRSRWQRRAVEASRNAARATDNYVRESPWAFIACVAVAGFVIGLLLARPRRVATAGELQAGQNHGTC